LTTKLSQKVDELEALARELEQRVKDRTSELDIANRHLRELNKRKDEMVAIASHDLRSPLSGLLMVIDLMQKKDLSANPERRVYLLDVARKATDRMIAMVNDLLDASRIESGAIQLELEEVNVAKVIKHSLEPLAVSAQAKEIEVKFEAAINEPVVRGDRLKLSQIFNNLLTNAVKFTPRGGHVLVKVRPKPQAVEISVRDTGEGIPEDEIPFVFEKYAKMSTRPTAGEGQIGLGLSIVRQLVELHGGKIEVTSELGKGSTFTVSLPQKCGASAAGVAA